MIEQKFKLTNVVLYAKGWYKTTDDIWEDLKKILELDDYTPWDKNDVYLILLSATQKSNIYRWTELKEVLMGIHPNNCWKYGYYVKANSHWSDAKLVDTLPDYDMPTAFVYYVLSNLRFMENKYWNPAVPKYTKYPKKPNITINQVFNHFIKNK